MGWQDLLAAEEERVLPWVGGRAVQFRERTWRIAGALPEEHGWHRFRTGGGREATWVGPADFADLEFEQAHPVVRGYVVGDRLIQDAARVDPDPHRLVDQTLAVHLVEPGLERFCRAVAARLRDGTLVYLRQELPLGPEAEVMAAWQDRRPSVDDIPGVTPALDLAFRWLTFQRAQAEERRRERQHRLEEEARRAEEAARQQVEEERRRAAAQRLGTGAGRRALAREDFDTAAGAALALSGATLLDARPCRQRGEVVVQFRFRHRRFECVVERATMRVVDSGICLQDHATGERGDTRFTLESLPTVIAEAMQTGRLVVFRHVGDDE